MPFLSFAYETAQCNNFQSWHFVQLLHCNEGLFSAAEIARSSNNVHPCTLFDSEGLSKNWSFWPPRVLIQNFSFICVMQQLAFVDQAMRPRLFSYFDSFRTKEITVCIPCCRLADSLEISDWLLGVRCERFSRSIADLLFHPAGFPMPERFWQRGRKGLYAVKVREPV